MATRKTTVQTTIELTAAEVVDILRKHTGAAGASVCICNTPCGALDLELWQTITFTLTLTPTTTYTTAE